MKCSTLCILVVACLGLWRVDAAVTPPTAATPSLAVIVEKTLAQADAQQKQLQTMQYHQTANVEQLDGDNKTTRREVLQMIVRPGAKPSMQVVSVKGDNVPSSPEKAQAAARDVEGNKQNFTLHSLVKRFVIALEGEDRIGGQRAYVISFTPKPDQPYRDETEKVVNQLQGRMWISARTYNVLQTQATLAHPVSIAWFVAKIPTLDFHYSTLDSVAGFAPCQILITLRVQAPFIDFHERQTIDMANFRLRPSEAKPPG